ncbi:unnamed protein product [Urochloa humidicola]
MEMEEGHHRRGALRRRGVAAEEDGQERPKREVGQGGDPIPSAGKGKGRAAEGEADCNSCRICREPWASSGAHRICCIPCGHVYGRSCLELWLARSGG